MPNEQAPDLDPTDDAKPIGHLAFEYCGVALPIEPLKSPAGWYVGTQSLDGLPCSRESREYWPKKEECEAAMASNSWTQRYEP